MLYEGGRDYQFLKSYLAKRGYNSHKIRFEQCARSSGGSGEKRVRDVYPVQVRDIRRYKTQNCSSTRWLLVHIDADTLTVDERLRQLNAPLGSEAVNVDDPVCVVIPKRNTETWVYHLVNDGTPVSEEDDYKIRVTDDQVRDAGRRLGSLSDQATVNCPPSLRRSIAELERIPG